MKRMNFAIAVVLLGISLPTFADTQAVTLPITRVTLYTSGVGYFERTGTVDGDASLPLSFPVDQVNDVLKSLVLLDADGGSIQPVTYAAMDPVTKQLQAFGVDLSDNPDRATLLNRLRGARVVVTCSAPPTASPITISGVVVGVETKEQVTTGPDAVKTSVSRLNILAQDGLHGVALDGIESIKIDDAKLDKELREALDVVGQGRDDNQRSVILNFAGKGKRQVQVAYIAQTPLWQTSYRLLVGKKPLLQGWGLVQNTTQEDWKNVALTLVSGRPISFIQDLYTPLYLTRPTIKSQVAQAIAPVTYESNMNNMDAAKTGFAGGGAYAAAAQAPGAAPAPMSFNRALAKRSERKAALPEGMTSAEEQDALRASVNARGARLGEALFSYNIPIGVTIPRQQSAMIPFISSPITVQKVGIYNQGVNPLHPLSGARMTNTSGMHLLGGPITVFDDNGVASYAGDALIDDTQPGQTRLISYGLDVPVSVEVKPGDSAGHYLGFKIVKGVLTTMSRTVQETVYKIKNNGESDQIIVVEHPNPGDPWKLVEPAKPAEETQAVYRFDVDAPAGKATVLNVRMAMINWETVGLIDGDLDSIAVFMHDGAISADVRSALTEAVARRQRVADAQSTLNNLSAQIDQITSGQGRIRDNMKVLNQSSALYKRYTEELNTQEDNLASLMSKRDAQQEVVNKLQAELSNFLQNLTVGTLPGA